MCVRACTVTQVKCHACVGGTSVREDARILSSGVHVVVGTPGRVYDMLRRRNLRADSIKMFVLDEADEMLSRGFKDQIYDIFQLLPPKLQVRNAVGSTHACLIQPLAALVEQDADFAARANGAVYVMCALSLAHITVQFSLAVQDARVCVCLLWVGVHRITLLMLFLDVCRWVCSPPPCPLRPWRSPASS